MGPTTLAYVDVGGSGIETVAHLKENGRIVHGSKSAEFIDDYRRTRNTSSLDGLPGLEFPDEDAGV